MSGSTPTWPSSSTSGYGWRSTTSAPATHPSATCGNCRSTCSRSTSPSWTASPRPAQGSQLAKGIVDIARTLEIDVIAEGIETEEQRTLMTEMGCRYGQGYLLAMPMAWEQAQVLLRSGQGLVPATRPGGR